MRISDWSSDVCSSDLEAPVRILLTGHMDTVFAVDHPFQMLEWLEEGMLNGPGVADMKGGLALMLAALTAFETSPLASRLGYEVVINSDEEVGSPSSEEHTSELKSLMRISYAVFCLK